MLTVVQDPGEPNSIGGSLLDEIVRDGARQMLAAALRAEVAARERGGRSVAAAGCPQWLPRAAGGDHRGEGGVGAAAAGEDKRTDPALR